MEVKAVLFDLDDTLLVEMASAEEAFLETCKRAQDHFGLDPAELHQTLRREAKALWYSSPERATIDRISISHWEALWAKFLGDDPELTRLRQWARYYRQESWQRALRAYDINDPDFAKELGDEFRRQRERRHILFPDTRPILDALHGHYRLGLVTNGLSCLQHEKIDGSGLAPFFDVMIVAGDLGIAKPDPRVFAALLEPLNVTAGEAVMVGNSVRGDIGGAQNAGIKAVLIHRGEIHGQDDSITPDRTLTDLRQLTDYLNELNA